MPKRRLNPGPLKSSVALRVRATDRERRGEAAAGKGMPGGRCGAKRGGTSRKRSFDVGKERLLLSWRQKSIREQRPLSRYRRHRRHGCRSGVAHPSEHCKLGDSGVRARYSETREPSRSSANPQSEQQPQRGADADAAGGRAAVRGGMLAAAPLRGRGHARKRGALLSVGDSHGLEKVDQNRACPQGQHGGNGVRYHGGLVPPSGEEGDFAGAAVVRDPPNRRGRRGRRAV
mmetsp:Transcript_66369/g.158625  ORF Transcript_66369/g.158625 Transcript_66369/m.158625 type:complete len:231 (+) Transcript_66369:169-861(+)